MSKEELIQFLKDNLRIELSTEADGMTGCLTVRTTIFICDEEVSNAMDYCYPQTDPNKGY